MDIQEMRNEIDQIDDALLTAFLRRMELAGEIGAYKAANALPVLSKTREREILDRVSRRSGELAPYSHRLYKTLFELSRAYQSSIVSAPTRVGAQIRASLAGPEELFPADGAIGVQGVEGAYSQLAADKLFPRGNLIFFKTFDAVFDAVESGLCKFGVLPIENSSNGSVRAVYDLIRAKNVSIVRSTRLCVRHALLVKPGTELSDIREIHSHEQALGQCGEFLRSLGDNVRIIPEPNTAIASQLVAASERPGVAAIASSECARLYGLEQLSVRVQDSDNNYTRFIVIAREPKVYPGADRVTLILAIDHSPGALYEVLALFAANEINLLKLESRPVVGHDFEFLFFFEIEASVRDSRVVAVLEELERVCPEFKYLGNYLE